MKVVVAGLGLIGGSFYKASLKAGHETIGLHHHDAPEALHDAELVLVCMPPPAIVPWVKAHAAHFKKGAVVVDICGVKVPIMSEMATVPQDGWTFVGGHPMAGREVAGYENSLADLFVGASMIVTPADGTADEILATLKAFFASVGFTRTVVTTPERHDDMIAFTSQLCHIISTAYTRDKRVQDSVGFSAGSYDDMTRIATQNADDWSALYFSNQTALLDVLDGFIARLSEFRETLATGDLAAMKKLILIGSDAKKRELIVRNATPDQGDL